MTLAELVVAEEVRLRALGRSVGTIYLQLLALRRLVAWCGESRSVEEIGAADAARHMSELWRGRSARTVRREVASLRQAFGRALRGSSAPNPWTEFATVSVDPVEIRIVTEEEERALRAVREGRLGLWVAVLAETGARAGEICGLRSCDVLQDRFAIRIECRAESRTKTRRSRMCALSEEVHRELRLVFGRTAAPWGPGTRRQIYDRLRRLLLKVCSEMGIRLINPHDFRRTLATRLALRGVHPSVAARVMGHSNPSTTMAIYTRVVDADASAAASATWIKPPRSGVRTGDLFAGPRVLDLASA